MGQSKKEQLLELRKHINGLQHLLKEETFLEIQHAINKDLFDLGYFNDLVPIIYEKIREELGK